MIKSIHEVLDAYTRQGRLNAKAALGVLHLQNEDVAKRTAITPAQEFTLDVCALAHERLGTIIRRSKTRKVTAEDFSQLRSSSIKDAKASWESAGRKVPEVNTIVLLDVNVYVAYSIQGYLWGRCAVGEKCTDVTIEKFAQEHGFSSKYTDIVFSLGVLLSPEAFLNERTDDVLLDLFQRVKDIVNPDECSDAFPLDMPAAANTGKAFISATYPDGRLYSYFSPEELVALGERHPDCLLWSQDSQNPQNYSDPTAYYCFTTRGVACVFGAFGASYELKDIPADILHDLVLDLQCCGKFTGSPTIGAGLIGTRESGPLAAKDLTSEINQMIGWTKEAGRGSSADWMEKFFQWYQESNKQS